MELPDIKQQLSILTVLSYYGMAPDRNKRLRCPFHDDHTPSMQVYPDTGSVYCFSSNCRLGGKVIDQIDFIMYRESCTKHEAIIKAKAMLNYPETNPVRTQEEKHETPQEPEINTEILSKIFNYFRNGFIMRKDNKAKNYLQSRGLPVSKLENLGIVIGYNSAQFHHRGRISPEDIQACEQSGLLIKSTNGSRTEYSYTPWASHCVIFPLTDEKGTITGMYGRRTVSTGNRNNHYYLKNSKGLFYYPKSDTEKLIITESIIDFLSIYAIDEIRNEYDFLPIYGTNRLNDEHKAVIGKLEHLREIIFFLDGDDAGRKAAKKYSKELSSISNCPKGGCLRHKFSIVNCPEGEDINSLLQGHEPALFSHLLDKRKILFSPETSEENKKGLLPSSLPLSPENNNLDTSNPDYITYNTKELKFTLLGGISIKQLDRMRVTLRISRTPQLSPLHSIRQNIDLYNDGEIEKYIRRTAERLEMGTGQINSPLYALIEQLEKYRLYKRERQKQQTIRKELSAEEKAAAITRLKQPDLIVWLRAQIEKTGLVNEEDNGLLLFLIFLTRHFKDPLHALVHGLSGSGKTHLLKSIIRLVPPEVVYTTTAITENVLFYPPYKAFWKHKILLLEDLDGSYSALLPLREFMSNQYISKLSTEHDPKSGEFKQKFLEAEGPVCIAGATTKDKLYEDNANRSFIIHVNESKSHKNKIMAYQNKIEAGLIDEHQIHDIATLICNMQRILKPVKVINPYAMELRLPDYVFKPLRTNTHYLTLIRVITYFHQYQLPVKKTRQGTKYIATTLDHIAIANTLSKKILLRKSDELGGQLRGFFEALKKMVQASENPNFYAKDIRIKLRMHPMKINRYLRDLEMRSYIAKTGGNQKKGYEYEVKIWDDYDILKDGINLLDKILTGLKKKYNTSITVV